MVRVHFHPTSSTANEEDLIRNLRGNLRVENVQERDGGKVVCDIYIPETGKWSDKSLVLVYLFISSSAALNGYQAKDRFGKPLS